MLPRRFFIVSWDCDGSGADSICCTASEISPKVSEYLKIGKGEITTKIVTIDDPNIELTENEFFDLIGELEGNGVTITNHMIIDNNHEYNLNRTTI